SVEIEPRKSLVAPHSEHSGALVVPALPQAAKPAASSNVVIGLRRGACMRNKGLRADECGGMLSPSVVSGKTLEFPPLNSATASRGGRPSVVRRQKSVEVATALAARDLGLLPRT